MAGFGRVVGEGGAGWGAEGRYRDGMVVCIHCAEEDAHLFVRSFLNELNGIDSARDRSLIVAHSLWVGVYKKLRNPKKKKNTVGPKPSLFLVLQGMQWLWFVRLS